MSLREQAKDSATESTNNRGRSGEEYEGIQLTGDETFIKIHPGVFFTGIAPEGEGNPLIRFPPKEEYDQHEDQGSLGVVVDDPELIVSEEEETEGTFVLDRSGDDFSGPDLRVYNEDREGTESTAAGVTFDAGQGQRLYDGEVLDEPELPDGRAVLMLTGKGSTFVARALDIAGGEYAGMDPETGQVNNGLIEHPFYDEDGNRVDVDGDPVNWSWRYARPQPELRPSLFGKRIGVLLDWHHNMVNMDELDDDARERLEESNRRSYHYAVFDIDEGEELQPTVEGEPILNTYLRWRFDPEVGRLPDDQWEFVEQYVDAVEEGQVSTDEDEIQAEIEENAEEFDSDPETTRIVNAIQNIA